MNTSAEGEDELSKKISILQSIPIFKDTERSDLMAIAANITPKTFKYGEFLIKKGEVPPGLIYIAEGQCKVVAKKIG